MINSQSKQTSPIMGICRASYINRKFVLPYLFIASLILSPATDAATQTNTGNIPPVIINILLNDETPVESNKVKVFILAGQPNMEGKGRIFTLQENIDKMVG